MAADREVKRKEIYTYEAPWLIYGMNWSVRQDSAGRGFRLALGSFIEEYNNKVEIIQLDDETKTFVKRGKFDHPYPTTKIMWSPSKDSPTDLLATTGDYLRIWNVGSSSVSMVSLLNNVRGARRARPCCPRRAPVALCPRCHLLRANPPPLSTSQHPVCRTRAASTAPPSLHSTGTKRTRESSGRRALTPHAPSGTWRYSALLAIRCACLSAHATPAPRTRALSCDAQTQQAKTQLIAHDKEVYDIAFAKNEHLFASVGADGSVRMFDLRSLEHSTIIYETPEMTPLLRLGWNKQDPNYLATLMQSSSETVILDIR
jgi:DDB1- and CUL4-associated factor 7